MKRVFGLFEAVFDIVYLSIALIFGIVLISTSASNSLRMLAGIMALILALGDSFHLLPRIGVINVKIFLNNCAKIFMYNYSAIFISYFG